MKKTFDAQGNALPHVQQLHPYIPGEQPKGDGWVKLNTNENPYPASPSVAAAIQSQFDQLQLYPEPTSYDLRVAIAKRYGFQAQNVIIGNGSDNILDMIVRSFGGSPGVGYTLPSYSLYPVVAAMSGQRVEEINFERSLQLDVASIAATGAKIFFLTNPNAPTGVAFGIEQIEQVLQAIDGLLVVDEAYVDFGGKTSIPLLQLYDNLIVVRTFSKSYSLAGMRVGFALASESVISLLDRVRDAYNVDRIAQAAAIAALEDDAYFTKHRQKIISTRENVRKVLIEKGWHTYPSAANFLFTEPRNSVGDTGPIVAASLFEFLKEKRILVRYFPGHPLTCAFVRVSVGKEYDMQKFLTAVDEWLNNV